MFEIGLQVTRNLDNFSLDDYLATRAEEETEDDAWQHEIDCVLGLTMEICGRLQEMKVVDFVVRGFGQDPWMVSVDYDLSMMIQDLPEIFEWIDNGGPDTFKLMFAAQGTERTLFFKVAGNAVEIECTTWLTITKWNKWQPEPKIETSNLATLDRMFSQVLTTFVSESNWYFPDLIESKYFEEWGRIPSIKRRLEAQ